MSPRTISHGELAPGQMLTVIDAVAKETRYQERDEQSVMVVGGMPTDPVDRLRGLILEVKSIDLPLVLFSTLTNSTLILDVRKFQFMEVKPEFIAAVKGTINDTTENGDPIDVRRLAKAHDALAEFTQAGLKQIEENLQKLRPPTPVPPTPTRGFTKGQLACTMAGIVILLTIVRAFTK